MTSVSKNIDINKPLEIVHKWNNTTHKSIKVKPIDNKANTCIDLPVESYIKKSKFKVGDQVLISKYKKIFWKGYIPNWTKEVFVIKKMKQFHGHTWLYILMVKKSLVLFTK